ncbi:ferric reductase metalloreductase [Trichoderma arundinaceum]|uniref:ferric-chelate reductase (NADPH) n=1 Tax=Trichoderma arundinaceum TaxID=490622 RepID=A0A395NKQ2_TRIAR|nr:ferric reductase metalloreductase [Trichoderma arundinaceum]
MDGMDMSGDGMTGLGSDINHRFARAYWYITATVVGSLMVFRGINHVGAVKRLKAARDASNPHPTRPDGPLSQAWATATAMVREMSHPQLFVPIRHFTWLTPPPLGRVLVLLCYWAVVAYFMSWHAVVHDVNYWERIGYRNAWITLTQLPMIFLLGTKVNIIGFLVGTSHERLNWLHRWVARTMFVTCTVHGFHFWTEWVRADFVELELETMPMVKYGLGAWAILLWNVVIGFVPIRRLAYELWVLQHVAASIAMLVLVYFHIPTNALFLFWLAVSILVFDRAARWVLLLWQNLRFKAGGSACQGRRRVGHQILARAVGDSTTVVTIKDVHFDWAAGQHIYLWIPRLGPLEAHPYTIACARKLEGTCCCNSIQLILRKHKGFSKRIHSYASKNPEATLTGFLSGPYGAPPRWDIYESMVLIGASTGASFTLPLLEAAAQADSVGCVKRIEVLMVARTYREIEYYVQRAQKAGDALSQKGVTVNIHVAVTNSALGSDGLPLSRNETNISRITASSHSSSSSSELEGPIKAVEKSSCCCDNKAGSGAAATTEEKRSSSSSLPVIREYTTRPSIEQLIRQPVEAAYGETAVVVCGGPEIVATTRNCVSRLSDERAVHKGTGAQGIHLHVEEYSF